MTQGDDPEGMKGIQSLGHNPYYLDIILQCSPIYLK